jgi:ketosteroid isomerase-like protein
MSAGDFDALGAMLDESFVVHEAPGLPYGGDYHGIAGWRALSQAVVSTWAGFRIKPLEFLGETTDTFVVRFAISGRSRKTGKTFESTVLELWKFNGVRLREITPYYWDTHALEVADGTHVWERVKVVAKDPNEETK